MIALVRVLFTDLVRHPVRTLLPGLALAIGLACMVGAIGLSASFDRAMTENGTHTPPGATVSIRPGLGEDREFTPAVLTKIRQLPDVRQVSPVRTTETDVLGPDGRALRDRAGVRIEPADPKLAGTVIKEGRLPSTEHEVAVDPTSAKRGHPIGGTLTIADRAGNPERLRVVGIAAMGPGDGNVPSLVATPKLAESFLDSPNSPSAVNLVLSTPAPSEAVVNAISTALGDGFDVRTGEQARALERPTGFSGSPFVMASLLALATAVLVAGAAFRAMATSRSRRTALLRALGAGRGALVGASMAEAVVIGTASAVLALVSGWLVTAGMIAGLGATGLWDMLGVYAVSADPPGVLAVAATLVVGILAAMVAALRPAIRASAVPPVAALSAVPDAPVERRAGVVRLVFGALLLAVAVLLAALGIVAMRAEIILPSAVIAVVALFGTLGPIFVPFLLRLPGMLAGAAGRLLGPVGAAIQSASREPSRTPRRAAAIALPLAGAFALLAFGVTGADSVRTFVSGQVEPASVDVIVGDTGSRPLPSSLLSGGELADTPGVANSMTLRGSGPDVVPATISSGTSDTSGSSGALGGKTSQRNVAVTGADPVKLAGVLSADAARTEVGGAIGAGMDSTAELVRKLGDGTALAGNGTADVGNTLVIGSAGKQRTVRVVGSLPSDLSRGTDVLVSASTFTALGVPAHPIAVLAKAAPAADLAAVRSAIVTKAADRPTVRVALASDVDTSDLDALSSMTWLGWGMLSLSILAAISGVVATTAVSVTERRRELGLARALGSTRTGVGVQIVTESILLAVGTAVAGTVLGYLYAVACLSSLGMPAQFPQPSLLIAIGVVAALAILAALVPAVRAARVRPTVALAAT